jgi:hypothetical protein
MADVGAEMRRHLQTKPESVPFVGRDVPESNSIEKPPLTGEPPGRADQRASAEARDFRSRDETKYLLDHVFGRERDGRHRGSGERSGAGHAGQTQVRERFRGPVPAPASTTEESKDLLSHVQGAERDMRHRGPGKRGRSGAQPGVRDIRVGALRAARCALRVSCISRLYSVLQNSRE